MSRTTLFPADVFQSTPSTQRETGRAIQGRVCSRISIHSLYAEGDAICPNRMSNPSNISIHSLYAEGDSALSYCLIVCVYFNPLPLRRGRQLAYCQLAIPDTFQSTPSTQRETKFVVYGWNDIFISIHSLYAEGDRKIYVYAFEKTISIHSLYAEGDSLTVSIFDRCFLFQSTPSTQRETERVYK